MVSYWFGRNRVRREVRVCVQHAPRDVVCDQTGTVVTPNAIFSRAYSSQELTDGSASMIVRRVEIYFDRSR